jgi:small-conductance mechanosensitive channel
MTGARRPLAGRLRRLAAAVLAAGLILATPISAPAQETPATPTTPQPAAPATTKSQTAGKGGTFTVKPTDDRAGAPDYKAWDGIAERSERVLANPDTGQATLEFLRSQLVDWRAAFLSQQNANSARIATLRKQIDALGPAPAEGETEAEEIAKRRQTLTETLVRLQAPRLAAEEAYSRADGLIGEIDRTLRERQANQLLQLYPSPLNPANWPQAALSMRDLALSVWTETAARWKGEGRKTLLDNLPAIVVLTVVGAALMWRGRVLLDQVMGRFLRPQTVRGRRVVAFLRSVLAVLIPAFGLVLIAVAPTLSGLLGPVMSALAEAIPAAGLTVLLAYWLGALIFAPDPATPSSPAGSAPSPLPIAEDRRAEGVFLATSLGVVLAAEDLRKMLQASIPRNEAAISVLSFPILVTAAILLLRLGQVLYRHAAARGAAGDDPAGASAGLMGLLGRAIIVLGVLGTLLGAVGYVSAASAMVYSAALSLGLIGLLIVVQRLVADLYGLITGSDSAGQDGLVPVLIGFAMILMSLPLFAMIWGARPDDLTELWQRFLEGFQLGETRVSPTDFMVFVVIFALGYGITRLVQGALKSSVLPRTNLDPGGQTAVVSGLGYVGIFLSALTAINYAGIDLSGLAIVAGALSVGIGFGLQNIVSNFISGIILLVERPVSEGDWIEVGTVQGTVKSISVRSTRIQTFDRSDVIVPNADLVTGRVTNWTRFNLTGRLIVPVLVVHNSDTRKVERILREIAEAQPMVVLNPPPVIALMGFTLDGIQFEMRMILRDVNFSVTVRSEVNHQIVTRFAAEGVEMRPGLAAARAAPEPPAETPPRRAPRKGKPESVDALPRADGEPTL